jgi:hypothetical protein
MYIGNVDAIDFTFNNKKHIRVYYQTKDKQIRETSYEAQDGWFVRQEKKLQGTQRQTAQSLPHIGSRTIKSRSVFLSSGP